MKRPLAWIALLYAGGLLLGEFFPLPLAPLFSVSLAVAAAALLFRVVRSYLIWPLIVLTGWTNFVCHTAIVSPHDLRLLLGDQPALATICGKLCAAPDERVYLREQRESFRTLAQVVVTAVKHDADWQPAAGRVAVVTTGILPNDYFAGEEVEVYGVIGLPPRPLAEGLFDYRTFLRRQEIYYQLKAESSNDWHIVSSRAPPLGDRFRAWAKRALSLSLTETDEPLRLEQALTLGDRTVLTENVAEPFVQASTYHIFAVDGLRMGMIFGIFFVLFRAMRLPRGLCGLLLVPLIWFYVALTGWPTSAIRAAVMLTIVIGGWSLKRPVDLLNSLFAAALVILIWNPQELFQAGFQLSFFVVLCIVLIVPTFDAMSRRWLKQDPLLPVELVPRWRRLLNIPLRFFLDLLLSSWAAWLGSLPLTAYYFHIITPVSTPANVFAVPLCALVLASNLISLLLAGWFPTAAGIFNHAGWFLMNCIRVTSHWFASWPAAYFYVAAPSYFTIGLYYLIVLAIFTGWLFQPKWRARKIAGLALLSVIGCAQHLNSVTRLTILPLSGGSAVYVEGRNDLLIDCGNTNSVEFVTKPFLRARGVNRLPCLALTHGAVHCTGGAGLLDTIMPIKTIAASLVRFRSPSYQQFMEKVREQGPQRLRTLNRDDHLGEWTVLYPGVGNHFPNADDNALVLRGEFNGVQILLLSELGRDGQSALLAGNPDLRADIVVSGLPARGEPLSDALLNAIAPKLMVVADSEFPAAKQASPALRARLERRGVPVLYTRDKGAVKMTFRHDYWTVSTADGVARYSYQQ